MEEPSLPQPIIRVLFFNRPLFSSIYHLSLIIELVSLSTELSYILTLNINSRLIYDLKCFYSWNYQYKKYYCVLPFPIIILAFADWMIYIYFTNFIFLKFSTQMLMTTQCIHTLWFICFWSNSCMCCIFSSI